MKVLPLLVWVAIVAPISASAQNTKAPDRFAAAIPTIDRAFREYQIESNVSGVVYGVVVDGRLVHVKSLGIQETKERRPVTPDTLFRIASMTKSFTALSILRLRDEGHLSLDAPAETYVPELRGWRYPTSDSPRVRVRDLLHHTAGFVTDDPWGDRQTPMPEEEFTALLRAGVPFNRAPGIAFEYSNFGYALLGRIVRDVSGAPYREYVGQHLLQPLRMSSSGYEVSEAPPERRALGYRWENGAWQEEPTMAHGAFGAMGGLQTSAHDYARYVAWLLSAWPARDGADDGPVRRSSVRELATGSNFPLPTTRPSRSGAAAERQTVNYGMGMRVVLDPALGLTLSHSGGYPGYGSHVLLLPQAGVGIFAFTNLTYGIPAGAVWDSAGALQRIGALKTRALPVSEALAAAYRTVGAIYKQGDLAAAGKSLAMNFLLDRSAENWRTELRRLRGIVGECDTSAPITATGALSGTFSWRGENRRLEGSVLLAPTNPPTIQSLRFTIAAP